MTLLLFFVRHRTHERERFQFLTNVARGGVVSRCRIQLSSPLIGTIRGPSQ